MSAAGLVLIEDNPSDAALALRALRRLGVGAGALVLRDGAQALEHFFGAGADARALPSLVLLDLKLPKVDGHEVLRRLRADRRTRRVPVVVLTSSAEQSDRDAVLAAGADGFEVKALDFEEYLRTLARIVGAGAAS